MARAQQTPFQETLRSAFGLGAKKAQKTDRGAKAKEVLNELIIRSGLAFDVNELRAPGETVRQTVSAMHRQVVLAAISSHIVIYEPPEPASKRGDPKPKRQAKGRPEYSLNTSDLRVREYRDDCMLCEAAPRYDRGSWIDARARELEAALRPPGGLASPQIVCFGELAYPPPDATAFATSVEYVNQFGRHQAEFEERIRKVCANHASAEDTFLFLGSYRCPITLYNVGMVAPRGALARLLQMEITGRRLTRDKLPEPTRETKPVSVPIAHRKRFPAKRANEHTRVPPDNQFRVFGTPVGRVAVLICSDVVDLNQFLFIVRYNDSMGKADRINYVLVPSYNNSSSLVAMCKQLSEIAAVTVMIVNANANANVEEEEKEKGKDNVDTADRKTRTFPVTSMHCCGHSVRSPKSVAVGRAPKGMASFLKVRARNVEHTSRSASFKRVSRITWFAFDTKGFEDFVNRNMDAIKVELGLSTKWKRRSNLVRPAREAPAATHS